MEEKVYGKVFVKIPGVAKFPDKPRKHGLFIAVGINEHTIPHFHVFRNKKDMQIWKNGASIFIANSRYYYHPNHYEYLSRREMNAVVERLKTKLPASDTTYWEYLVSVWNENNQDFQIDSDTKMPDYDYGSMHVFEEDYGYDMSIGERIRKEHGDITCDHIFQGMGTMGDGFMGIKITIFEYESMVPHFHFYKNIPAKRHVTCDRLSEDNGICFLEPKYYSHEGNNQMMSQEEIDGLLEYLKSEYVESCGFSTWEWMICFYNGCNAYMYPERYKEIPISTPIPDYKSDMPTVYEKETDDGL